jgi:hypothetical protein
MKHLIERIENLAEGVKTAKLPGALRRYAVTDMKGKHVATVDATTFSEVALNWIRENLGVGKWLVFQPPKDLKGRPSHDKFWVPILSIVTKRDGGNRAEQAKPPSGSERHAPKGYGKDSK